MRPPTVLSVAGRDLRVTNALVKLMRRLDDPAELSDDELLRAVVNVREMRTKAEEVVAEQLQARGWSTREIGDRLGLDHKTIQGWLRRAEARRSDHPIEDA